MNQPTSKLDPNQFWREVYAHVPAYRDFFDKTSGKPDASSGEIPISDKINYLLEYPIEDLCWNGTIGNCHLIGSSSGFSKTGSVFWPKRPEDERNYIGSLETMLSVNYGIDKKKTLILCCMALGSWMGGMTITSALRILAAQGKLPLTVSTPGLNLSEAVEIYARFHPGFEQVLWITNPSSINVIYSLIKRKKINFPTSSNYFPAIGEYYSEDFRENIARKFGFNEDELFNVWTGYGSADTGDLGVETAATITLRKFLNRNRRLSKQIFNSDDPPMILDMSDKPYIEIINHQIVVTKDQLVPLVRYNTGDEGGLLKKDELNKYPEIPKAIIDNLNPEMLYVYGRASDSIIFYGTNLNIKNIHNYFLSLPESYGYAGLFQVKAHETEGITEYWFNIFVNDFNNPHLKKEYAELLIGFLKRQSLEFSAKYINICNSLGRDLITVSLDDISKMEGNVKHRFIVE
jgi:phenylacetate-CoA ligase